MLLINKYFPALSNAQQEKFLLLGKLYTNWNKQINLISRKDIENLYERHILHSLSIAKFVQFNDNTKILDVGTGGGFPGIPLAILYEKCNFHLIDSVKKKINVVIKIINECNLRNITTQNCRAEHVSQTYDFVVSRAVTNITTLIKWNKKNVSTHHSHTIKNGFICLKGGEISKELKEINDYNYKIMGCKNYFEEDFFKTKKIIHVF